MLTEKASLYKLESAIAAQVLTSSDKNGDVDLQGFNDVFFVVNVGANGGTLDGSNRLILKILDSDDNSTFTAVTDSTLTGGYSVTSSGTFQLIDDGAEANTTYKVAYTGIKRYVRINADINGTISLPISVTALLGSGLAPQA